MIKINCFLTVIGLLCICFKASAQVDSEFLKKREVFIEMSGGVKGYQDSRFYKTRFSGVVAEVKVGTRLIRPHKHIKGFWTKGQVSLGNSKDVDNASSTYNLGVFQYEYQKYIRGGWYFGGQIDFLDIYFSQISNLVNYSTFDFNNTLSAKLTYRKNIGRKAMIHSSFVLGLLSFQKTGNTSTFIVPEKTIKKGDLDLYSSKKDLVNFKKYSLHPMGVVNKMTWQTEVVLNRFVILYKWHLYNHFEKRKSITHYTHTLGIKYNLINKTKN